MEIRQLATFIRVAQFNSFSRAAESLGYSQSAVTRSASSRRNWTRACSTAWASASR